MDEIKYNNRFRIPSARASWHDYSGGTYFVTICTKGREHFFGEIKDGVMTKTEIGDYLEKQILLTEKMRADMNVEIPLFVVMPNHVHLIVVIGQKRNNMSDDGRDEMHCASTTSNTFSPQSKNMASVIRGIKIATKNYATKQGILFGWQPRFHDHIIRNIDELNRIALYIEHNVSNWKQDYFHG